MLRTKVDTMTTYTAFSTTLHSLRCRAKVVNNGSTNKQGNSLEALFNRKTKHDQRGHIHFKVVSGKYQICNNKQMGFSARAAYFWWCVLTIMSQPRNMLCDWGVSVLGNANVTCNCACLLFSRNVVCAHPVPTCTWASPTQLCFITPLFANGRERAWSLRLRNEVKEKVAELRGGARCVCFSSFSCVPSVLSRRRSVTPWRRHSCASAEAQLDGGGGPCCCWTVSFPQGRVFACAHAGHRLRRFESGSSNGRPRPPRAKKRSIVVSPNAKWLALAAAASLCKMSLGGTM